MGLRCYVVERCRAKCSVTFAKVQIVSIERPTFEIPSQQGNRLVNE